MPPGPMRPRQLDKWALHAYLMGFVGTPTAPRRDIPRADDSGLRSVPEASACRACD